MAADKIQVRFYPFFWPSRPSQKMSFVSVYSFSHIASCERDSELISALSVFDFRDVQVSVEFCPLLSSVRPSETSDQLLKYEQGRFDLAELVKRENISNLQTKFEGKTFPTRGKNEEQRKQLAKEDSGKMIAQEIEELQKILEQRLQEYDETTDYGNNSEKQSEYALKFEQLKL